MTENWLKRSLKQVGLLKKPQPKQGLSLQYVYPTKRTPPKKNPARNVVLLPNTLIFLMRSIENLSQVCHYAPLQDITENLLLCLPQHAETNLEKVFFVMHHAEYRYKNLLHGWFGVKNDRRMSWSEVLHQLKKIKAPLSFEDNAVTQIKNYFIFKLTLIYETVEKSTPYLVGVIDLHLEKIRACLSEHDIQALFENMHQLAGKHSLAQLLYAYGKVPTYYLLGEKLVVRPWQELKAFVLAEMQPVPVKIGVSL